jgi:CheY-like chemotaxis protein
VLLDIGLPGLNGFEIGKQLRQRPDLQNAVLVAITGYGQESDLKRSFEVGFDHHLVKPVDFQKVLHILASVSALTAR